MRIISALLLSSAVVVVLPGVLAQDDPVIVYDGRIAQGTEPKAFDDGYTPYDIDAVRPENQKWADIISTYGIPQSLFDEKDQYQGYQITITDDSIVSATPGYRRAALTPKSNDYVPDYSDAVLTYHFSIQQVAEKPMNISHEYDLVFLESAADTADDDSFHIFEIRYGNDYGDSLSPDYDQDAAGKIRVLSYNASGDSPGLAPIYTLDFVPSIYLNFAITIDYKASTISVWSSLDQDELTQALPPQSCTVDKAASLQIGIQKVPTGVSYDPSQIGEQEQNISEALIYSGVFIEDSSNGVVTTKPSYSYKS